MSKQHPGKRPKMRALGFIIIALVALGIGFFLGGRLRHPAPHENGGHESHEAAEEAAPETGRPVIWTCSMHPQIRADRPGLCPLCAMDLIPAPEEDEGAPGGMRRLRVSEAARALMRIQTAPVERLYPEAELRLTGQVAIDETRLAAISAWAGGRLEKLHVDFTGMRVRQGAPLVDLYSPDLIAAQEELRAAARTARTLRENASGTAARAAETALEGAREKLRRWGLTSEQIARAEGDGAIPDRITIHAPIGGTVVDRKGQEGMYVAAGQDIYKIADLSRVWVLIDAYEPDLVWLRHGQEAEFSVEAHPGERFTGRIAFIDPLVASPARTVRVRLNADNADGRLKPGMFVRARVKARLAAEGAIVAPDLEGKWISPMHPEVIRDGPGACPKCGMALVPAEEFGYAPTGEDAGPPPLTIPASAPLVTGKRAIVYVDIDGEDGPVFEGREVVLGPRAGERYIVRSGLEAGERVVVNGNFKIDSAIQLHARPSMMSPDAPLDAGIADAPLDLAAQAPLETVAEAHDALAQTLRPGAREEWRAAAEALEAAAKAVDREAYAPAAQNVWIELAMRIQNGARALAGAESLDEAGNELARIDDAIAAMREAFGLAEERRELAVPEVFLAAFGEALSAYLTLQIALADDDPAASAAAAGKLAETFAALEDGGALSGPALGVWREAAPGIAAGLEGMAGAQELDALRTPFEDVSLGFIELARHFPSPLDAPLYLAHCPMAFDFEGADWLQEGDTVLNPYFGAEMLRCGTVRERLSAGRAEDAGNG